MNNGLMEGLLVASLVLHVITSIVLGIFAWAQIKLTRMLQDEIKAIKADLKKPETYSAILEVIKPVLEQQRQYIANGIVSTLERVGDVMWQRIEDKINGKYGQMIKQAQAVGNASAPFGPMDILYFFMSKNKKQAALQIAQKVCGQEPAVTTPANTTKV